MGGLDVVLVADTEHRQRALGGGSAVEQLADLLLDRHPTNQVGDADRDRIPPILVRRQLAVVVEVAEPQPIELDHRPGLMMLGIVGAERFVQLGKDRGKVMHLLRTVAEERKPSRVRKQSTSHGASAEHLRDHCGPTTACRCASGWPEAGGGNSRLLSPKLRRTISRKCDSRARVPSRDCAAAGESATLAR